jgi:hypothetical protein
MPACVVYYKAGMCSWIRQEQNMSGRREDAQRGLRHQDDKLPTCRVSPGVGPTAARFWYACWASSTPAGHRADAEQKGYVNLTMPNPYI